MDWIICIPSYHRADRIGLYTLKMLDSYNIPHDRIKIFVSEPEVAEYKKALPDYDIIPSVVGLIANRDVIRHYMPEGKRIVYMDDDIIKLSSVCDFSDDHTLCKVFRKENLGKDYYQKQMRLPDLTKFLDHAFTVMDKEDANLGGLYPVQNGFFATHKYCRDLRYIIGGVYFERNIHGIKLQGKDYSEDFERTCLFFKRDGKVIRFDSVMIHSFYYKGEGGLVETRTIEKSKEAQELLVSLYPEYLELVLPSTRNKFWNLKVKRVLRGGKRLGRTPSATSLVE
jgi:hypothetical protein